ncbi:5-(carboxyamino)imidazole ribonucleotide synthase [Phormidium tenue FACHB-886]|nr:5-(carboxyamino)imidazole ribonucleotide synthase [Phormidium tenue FACHB-886]
MKRVGIIGGGQLAWMMAAAAQKLNLQLAIQTSAPTDPAVAIATQTVYAPIDDANATAELASICDLITFENEFVDLAGLSALEQRGTQFYPELRSLVPLLDKYEQRSYLQQLGLPTPKFMAVAVGEDLATFGFPVVLKARRLGYDGRGTIVVKDQQTLESHLLPPRPEAWLLEEFVPFDRELAVMAARSPNGEIVVYPVVETQQVNQVCQRVFVTQEFEAAVVEQVETIARTLLNHLNYVGIMGIEFFLTQDGRVLVNETAPRTHNSGHYSLDACETSQFEQQLRAVCGLPLGSPVLNCAGAVMVNLLGYEAVESDYWEKRQQLAALPRSHVYWYGKSVSRPGRKLGHVTLRLEAGEGRSAAAAMAKQAEAIWYPA